MSKWQVEGCVRWSLGQLGNSSPKLLGHIWKGDLLCSRKFQRETLLETGCSGERSLHILLAWLAFGGVVYFWEVLPHQICVKWVEPAPALSHPCNTGSSNLKAHQRTEGRLLSCTECWSDLVRSWILWFTQAVTRADGVACAMDHT